MSDKRMSEHDSEHPLFRALVLMGGSLALGCGGSAVLDQGAAGSGSAQAGAAAAGAAGITLGGSAAGGARGGGAGAGGLGGATDLAGASAFDAGAGDCPPAQWDCSGLGQVCEPNLGSGGRPAGCVCDLTRPKSVADCSATEDLACLRAYTLEPDPNTWDTAVHVQCSCVPGPYVPDSAACAAACSTGSVNISGDSFSCSLPGGMTCDSSGDNCTATSADVLRQDGIVCGCAPVILK